MFPAPPRPPRALSIDRLWSTATIGVDIFCFTRSNGLGSSLLLSVGWKNGNGKKEGRKEGRKEASERQMGVRS